MGVTNYDFCGYATRNDIKCADGRIIRQNAFREQDGAKVPLVWNHRHDGPEHVIGHGILENRKDGVFVYGFLNDTQKGKDAKAIVQHDDIVSLSIFANKLIQNGSNVMHGMIREVSLVIGGANPGAFIEDVMYHSDDDTEDALIQFGEPVEWSLQHSDESVEGESEFEEEKSEESEELEHSDDESKEPEKKEDDKKTVEEVIDTMNEEQQKVFYYVISQVAENAKKDNSNEGGKEEMAHNLFEGASAQRGSFLSHADQENILDLAKTSSIGTLQGAIAAYAANGCEALQHGFSDNDLTALFPEYKDVKPGAPELITRDQTWVISVMNKVHKSPITRIRTRHMDARDKAKLRALGYVKGTKKKLMGEPKLAKRTTDPQTIYIKDKLERDDILDITDFDVVQYLYGIMQMVLKEELALAILIGDQRDDEEEGKIFPEHVRPIYGDDPLYTIYADVDIAAAKAELQGTETGAHFGDNYVYAEAVITAALYAREKYKGTGKPDFYCTPHTVNVMLLAKDMNGRRIYNTVEDLKAVLNVGAIETVEQFEGITRTDKLNNKKKLLGLMMNLADYQLGCNKGGEITKFEQFDIDFNQYKYLIETRVSGANVKLWSAIALEEPVGVQVQPSELSEDPETQG